MYKYDALSYTWGSQDLTHEVNICGKPYPVTSNLYGALEHLRREDGDKSTIWIDAICINQQDHYEQTQQVNMMAGIYRNGRLVVMWLGEGTIFDGISIEGIAFALLQQLQKVFEEHGLVDLDFQQTGPDGLACPGYGLPNTNAKQWIALGRLSSNSYFERIWIIQEVVMATKAILACGKLSIDWEVVRNFARSVQKGGSLGSLGIKVDYSMEKEPFRVWEKLALHSLTAHQSLLCLFIEGVHLSSQQSWISNWSDGADVPACLALYGKDNFRASKETKASVSVSNDLQTLILQGYIMDSVAMVSPNTSRFVPKVMKSGPFRVWLTKEEAEERTSVMAAGIMDGLEIAKSASQYNEGHSRDRELARTLCCNMLMTGKKADIDSAYRVHRWIITVMKAYAMKPLLEDSEQLETLQREV
ncbi:uncharacterized protein PAC_10302 [Phialocephala subalpina]|uniref:Heterokaryon incompatibility domain-containing protein n=1 Tax=Phialocephala subalpina TaxID=576137 RepID=A0A1L7X5U8_9HELO|nr:uncharacterized protein PAC_10302 [Phialocephala subalpina]